MKQFHNFIDTSLIDDQGRIYFILTHFFISVDSVRACIYLHSAWRRDQHQNAG